MKIFIFSSLATSYFANVIQESSAIKWVGLHQKTKIIFWP